MITLYVRQQKSHRCIEQSFGLCGTGRGWDDLGEWHFKHSEKNTFESVLMRWMKLEPIIQSEASQKEKHQYSILTHIYGI